MPLDKYKKRMLELVVVALVLVGVAVLLLSLGMLLGRKGFPETHVGSNPAMRERGIACHTSQHRDAQQRLSLEERLRRRAQ